MLESGISVLNAFNLLTSYTKDPNLVKIIKNIKENLEKGNTISDSFKKTNSFSKFIIIMLKVGEESGNLDSVTKTLYLHFEEKAKLNRKIVNSLIYPGFILLTTFAAALILMFNIVPLFEEVFLSISNDIPVKTKIILEFSRLLRENFFAVCFLIMAVVLLIIYSFKRNMYKIIIRNIPVISHINYQFNCYVFIKSLYLLNSSGISLNASLNMLQDIINEKSFRNKLKSVIKKINIGLEFNTAMKEEKMIDMYYLSLIAIGEQSGSIDKVLLHISESLLEKIKNKLKVITYMISPISLIFVGLITFFILSSLIVPLYENINMIE